MTNKTTLLDRVGGIETLDRVHKRFYDKVYQHPWLGRFFEGHDQTAIEKRQTQFMAEKMGGKKPYLGKEPYMAHRAMFITDKLFDIRTELLRESLLEEGLAEELIERWIRIDNAFRKQIVKNSISEFYATSWKYEKRVIIPEPR
ncbi:MAG: group 1 truncated hemoglobin [Gammaproteobacteria bacterium]|nr:group 1 truncated hemoglobin [Gammaproteobacteria bacterium]